MAELVALAAMEGKVEVAVATVDVVVTAIVETVDVVVTAIAAAVEMAAVEMAVSVPLGSSSNGIMHIRVCQSCTPIDWCRILACSSFHPSRRRWGMHRGPGNLTNSLQVLGCDRVACDCVGCDCVGRGRESKVVDLRWDALDFLLRQVESARGERQRRVGQASHELALSMMAEKTMEGAAAAVETMELPAVMLVARAVVGAAEPAAQAPAAAALLASSSRSQHR